MEWLLIFLDTQVDWLIEVHDIDPGAFKQDFLQRIIIEPNGIITNGAELNGNILKVSLTVEYSK